MHQKLSSIVKVGIMSILRVFTILFELEFLISSKFWFSSRVTSRYILGEEDTWKEALIGKHFILEGQLEIELIMEEIDNGEEGVRGKLAG